MLLHTAQGEDYILNLDDSGMHLECVIDGAALFLSEGRQRFELVSLETGETLMTTDCQLYSFGESFIIFRSKSDTDTYTETYFVYNSDGELTLETVANEVRTTYDDKLIIKRGAYTGIADMYGRWLLRGPSVMLYKI